MARRQNKDHKTIERTDGADSQNSEKAEKKENSDQKRQVDLGLDISTAVIGVCILDHLTGNLIKLDNIKLNRVKTDNMWLKADEAQRRLLLLQEENSTLDFQRIFVEENAKRFSPGFSSADTILTLAKMNGIVSWIARNAFGCEPLDVNVVSARARLGIKVDRKDKSKTTKEKVRIEVIRLYPDLPLKKHIAKTGKSKNQEVIDKECEDEIDAFVIAKGGQLIHKNHIYTQ